MNPFNEANLCPKCDFSADAKHNGERGYNRIQRTCRRCFYSWPEAPLDYDAEAEKAEIMEAHRNWMAAMCMYPVTPKGSE